MSTLASHEFINQHPTVSAYHMFARHLFSLSLWNEINLIISNNCWILWL